MQEEWRSINGFEGLYEISSFGQVKSLAKDVINNGGTQHRKERILKQNISKTKHCTVVLCKEGHTYVRLVHRLVAEAFIPNPYNKPVVDHIDTNPSNNSVENLRWATVQENALNPLTRKHLSQSKMGHEYWGRPLTEEERHKISEKNKGRRFTEEHKKKLSESHKGKTLSDEQIKKIAQKNTGQKRTEEQRKRMSNAMKGKHKGKHWIIEGGKRKWVSN